MIDEQKLINDLEQKGLLTDDEYSDDLINIILTRPQEKQRIDWTTMTSMNIIDTVRTIIIILIFIAISIYFKNWWLIFISLLFMKKYYNPDDES